MYECKCCWAPSEDVLCVDCSEFSIFEQIEHKKTPAYKLSYVLSHTKTRFREL